MFLQDNIFITLGLLFGYIYSQSQLVRFLYKPDVLSYIKVVKCFASSPVKATTVASRPIKSILANITMSLVGQRELVVPFSQGLLLIVKCPPSIFFISSRFPMGVGLRNVG